MKSPSTFSYVMKIIHDLTTVTLVAIAIALLAVGFGTDSAKMPLYLTQTFHTTYYTHHPSLTWSQPTDPANDQRVASTFFNCLRVVGVGADSSTKCGDVSDADYPTCLHNKTTSAAYIKKRLDDDLLKASKRAEAAHVTAVNAKLPALPQFTSATTMLAVQNQLSLIDTYLKGIDTPYAREARKIYMRYSHWQGIQGCVDPTESNGNTMSSIASTYDELWKCASEVLPTTDDQAFAFQQCVPLSAWPAQDELQTVYSEHFLGSYNHLFLTMVGAWVITSFAVYTIWLGESKSSAIGRPLEYFGRTGVAFAALCAIWNAAGGIILVAATTYLGGGKQNGFPMTIQTVLITGAVTIAATGYFLRDFWEQWFHMESDAPAYNRMRHSAARSRTLVPMAGYARIPKSSAPLSDDQMAPWVIFPWSDGWLLTDGLLLLAIMGTSSDVVTADAGRVFLAATYTAAAQSAFIRLFYEGHYSETAAMLDSQAISARNGKEIDQRGVRVMIFIVQMAILWFGVSNWWLLFQRYGVGFITAFAALSSLLPILVWFILSVLVENQMATSLSLTTLGQVSFVYNAVVRLIFIIVLMATATANADPNSTLSSYIHALEM